MNLKIKGSLIKIGLAVALMASLIFGADQCARANANAADARALYGDVQTNQKNYEDDLGRITSTVEAQSITNQSLLNEVAEKESEIEKIKGKVQAVTTVERTFHHTDTITDVQIVPGDTLVLNDTVYIFPTYITKDSSDWHSIDIQASSFETKYDFTMKDDFSNVLSLRTPLFKKNYIESSVKSLNPMITDQVVKTYTKEVNKKRWNISASAGFGLGPDGKLGPIIGITGGWSILQW